MTKQCLFIGGPDIISGTMQTVAENALFWRVAVSSGLEEMVDAFTESRIQIHDYHRHLMRDLNGNYHFVFFHNSIKQGDEMALLIQAATKKKP